MLVKYDYTIYDIVLILKENKDIIKVHMTPVGKLECFEASKTHFGPKITKPTTLFSIVLFWFCCQSAFSDSKLSD